MVGILGVLAAGAAQGYGAASNQAVDTHNEVAREQMREQLRDEFETRRFERQRKAGREDAAVMAQYEHAKYQRDRGDKLTDEEAKFEREMKKNSLLEEGRNRRNAASNAARMSAAELRAKASGGGGLLEGGKAQSTVGKTVQDLMALGLAKTPQEAYDLYEESGLARTIASSPTPMVPEDMMRYIQMWRSERSKGAMSGDARGTNIGGGVTADFIFNPKTGKLEPAQ